MRNSTDRRHSHITGLRPIDNYETDMSSADRRKTHDRRMENLSLEERQLLFSEMPSLKPPKPD